jgi:hypothetical protein
LSGYESFGKRDVHIQIMIHVCAQWMAKTADMITNNYDVDVAYAVQATALGEIAGHLQALYNNHAKECDKCAAKKLDLHELVVKNFGAAFNQAKREQEAEYANAASSADAMLEQIFKGHKK